jgi:pimeloyl-ACP methyl ester carboxylesterase
VSRPRLLLLHAFPFDGRMWDEVRARLEDAGLEADAPDLPGEGAIAEWADGLLEGDDRIVPVGSSLGGYAAFELWRRAPERIAALALVGTRPGADADDVREARDKTVAYLRDEGVEGLWPGLAPRLFAPTTTPEVVQRAEEIALAQPVERLVGQVLAMRDRPDSTALLPEISVPVLVVAGAEDQVVPLAEARAFASALPNAELARLDGTGHLPAFEWPAELARRLLRFLEDVP